MHKPHHLALWVTLISAIAVFMLAAARNDLFEFCTTRAYGWPMPWRIDFCECKGGSAWFPFWHSVINLSVVIGPGLLRFLGGRILKRFRR